MGNAMKNIVKMLKYVWRNRCVLDARKYMVASFADLL